MRVLIVGSGGLGTVLAGYLARSGVAVTLFVKPAQAPQLTSGAGSSVRITGMASFTAPVKVIADPPVSGGFDYLVVCVKARDTEAALAPLRGMRVETVLSVQNGVGKDALLARLFGRERVLGATCAIAAALQEPGVALHTFAGATLVGELDGRISVRGERLAAALRQAGLPASCVPQIVTLTWYKLTGYLRTAPVCALSRLDFATVALDADLARVCARNALEAARIAAAAGEPLWHLPPTFLSLSDEEAAAPVERREPWSEEELASALASMGRSLRERGVTLYPSLAQDLMAGRPAELEATAGDAIERAAALGVNVPSLSACTRLLRGMLRAVQRTAPPRTVP